MLNLELKLIGDLPDHVQAYGHILDNHAIDPSLLLSFQKVRSVSFDLTNLESFTWDGLASFMAEVSSNTMEFEFRNVPLDLIKSLIIMPKIPNFRLQSIKAAALKDGSFQSLKLDEIAISAGLSGSYTEIADYGYHPDIAKFALSESGLNEPTSVDEVFPSSWARENHHLLQFLVDYFTFIGQSLGISALLNHGNLASLDKLIDRIEFIAKSCEKGILYLDENYVVEEIDDMNLILGKIRASEAEARFVLRDAGVRHHELLCKFLISVKSPECSLKSIDEALQTYSKFCDWLYGVTVKFDEIGHSVGEVMVDLMDVHFIGEYFKRFRGQSLLEEEVDELRQKLNLKTAETEDDSADILEFLGWRQTVEGIADMTEEMLDRIDDCSEELQKFDLARQVIERRLMELDVLTNNLSALNKGGTVENFKTELLGAIFPRLRTAQEKLLFQYMFPDFEHTVDEGSANEGEVLFFD